MKLESKSFSKNSIMKKSSPKKNKARPSKEWIDFGAGLGRMRQASLARSEEDIRASALLLVDLVRDRARGVENSSHTYQSYWYALQELKKILADAEEKVLQDLFHLGVSVPEIFAWERMVISPKKQNKTTRKKR